MLSLCGMVACLSLLGGCDVPSFFDPGELGGLRERAREPLVVPILSEIDPVREQVNRSFATAQEPLPEDFLTAPADYTVGPNDLLEVTIYDLEGPGLQTIKRTRVSGTGNITLPFLTNVVPAQDLTEIEIQNAIADAYSKAGILERAQVSVSVFEARNQAFTISGAVGREGLFQIIDEDFRIFDALAQAGGVQSPFQEDVYVIRKPAKRKNGAAGPTTAPADGGTTQPIEDLAPPQS